MLQMEYIRPNNLALALHIIEQHPGITMVAGGTDLMVWVKNNKIKPSSILDVSEITELRVMDDSGDYLFLGASLTVAEIMGLSKTMNMPQGLVEACNTLGSPAVRNTATLGGNLGTSSPAGDISTMLQGLRAEVFIQRKNRVLIKPLAEFFLGPGKNVLAPNDLITGVRIPRFLTSRYLKFGLRKSLTISVASVAGSFYKKKDGSIALSLALGAVAPTPIRALQLEKTFSLNNLKDLQEYGKIAASEASPITDLRASAEYRKGLVAILTERVLALMLDDLSALGLLIKGDS